MKATVIKSLRERRERKAREDLAKTQGGSVPLHRTTSRAASIHESLYSNRVSFLRRAARKVGFGQKININGESISSYVERKQDSNKLYSE